MNDSEKDDLVNYLHSLPYPRPFVWRRFVYFRRTVYAIVCSLMLLGLVIVPIMTVSSDQGPFNYGHAKTTQLVLFFGALIVTAFVRISYTASKLFDDAKWLARFGAVGDANLLWVLGSENSSIVTYRFWDANGRERQREALIEGERDAVLPEIAAGDLVPVLFDPNRPDSRNLLWFEISRFVQLPNSGAIAAAKPIVRDENAAAPAGGESSTSAP